MRQIWHSMWQNQLNPYILHGFVLTYLGHSEEMGLSQWSWLWSCRMVTDDDDGRIYRYLDKVSSSWVSNNIRSRAGDVRSEDSTWRSLCLFNDRPQLGLVNMWLISMWLINMWLNAEIGLLVALHDLFGFFAQTTKRHHPGNLRLVFPFLFSLFFGEV